MTRWGADLSKLKCPDCGSTFVEFRRSGRLGCPQDYHVFREGILGLLDRVHRARHHTGKRPSRVRDHAEQPRELRALRFELRRAVEQEDYDRAASLRDEIRVKEQGQGR